jgi:hypothetical protein
MLITFPAVCEQHLNEFEFGSIKPSRFNNEIVENLFCQQKGVYNGNNSNPNYINYCKSVNYVLLGQSLKSRAKKSNAGIMAAQSFSVCTKEPVLKKMKKLSACLNTKQFYILNSFKGDFWFCIACFSILLDLDSFDDFFNFLSTGSFVHTEKDYAASIPAESRHLN